MAALSLLRLLLAAPALATVCTTTTPDPDRVIANCCPEQKDVSVGSMYKQWIVEGAAWSDQLNKDPSYKQVMGCDPARYTDWKFSEFKLSNQANIDFGSTFVASAIKCGATKDDCCDASLGKVTCQDFVPSTLHWAPCTGQVCSQQN